MFDLTKLLTPRCLRYERMSILRLNPMPSDRSSAYLLIVSLIMLESERLAQSRISSGFIPLRCEKRPSDRRYMSTVLGFLSLSHRTTVSYFSSWFDDNKLSA